MPLDIGDKNKVMAGQCPLCESDLDLAGSPEEGMNKDELVKPMYCPECDSTFHIVYEYEDVRKVED